MTQKQQPFRPRQAYFTKDITSLDVIFLAPSVQSFIQTSVHTIWQETATGKRFPEIVECQKKGFYGTYRDEVHCELCQVEAQANRYPVNSRHYAWVYHDDKIKWVEMPYTLVKAVEVIEQQFGATGSLDTIPIRLIRTQTESGGRKQTTYSAIPTGQPLAQGATPLVLQNNGLQALPALVGETLQGSAIQALTEKNIAEYVNKARVSYGLQPAQPVQQQQPMQQQPMQQPAQQPAQQPTQQPQFQSPQQPAPQVAQQPVQQPVQQPWEQSVAQEAPQATPGGVQAQVANTTPIQQTAHQGHPNPNTAAANPWADEAVSNPWAEPFQVEDDEPILDIASDDLPF